MNVFENDMKAIEEHMRRAEKERQRMTWMYDLTMENKNPISKERKQEIMKYAYNIFRFMDGSIRRGEISDYDYIGVGGEGMYFSIVLSSGMNMKLDHIVQGHSIDSYILGMKISWVEHGNENRLIESDKNLHKASSSPITSEYVPRFYLGGTMTYNRKKFRVTLSEHINGQTLDRNIPMTINKKELYLKIRKAVNALSGLGISHGDLKRDNIIVTPSGGIKIIDFGKSTYLPDTPALKVENFFQPGTERLQSNKTSLAKLKEFLSA